MPRYTVTTLESVEGTYVVSGVPAGKLLDRDPQRPVDCSQAGTDEEPSQVSQ